MRFTRRRLCTGDYGRWTLSTVRTWPWWDWSLGPVIGRDAFRPRPAVDAAVLRIERRAEPLVPRGLRQAWDCAVAAGFKGVGGSLHASLRTIYPRSRVDAAFASAGVPRDRVVGYVSPDDWVALVHAIEQSR